MHQPSSQHMQLAKYILAYLVGTVDAKLVYGGVDVMAFMATLIPVWVTRLMIIIHLGLCIHPSGGAIAGLTKAKNCAQNTTEAEYMALSEASTRLLVLILLLRCRTRLT